MTATAHALLPLADRWHDGHGPGWWIVFVPLFWGLVLFGIFWFLRSCGAFGRRGPERRETPVELLDRRFAEGTIDADEYRDRRGVLGG
jgi:putative membrane protein